MPGDSEARMTSATVCLNMIVRNEAPVIRRCLDSVSPFIDSWLIVDTGSEDGTQDRVRECLRLKPGELHERPWRNFGENRNEALALARGGADYLFFIDADETLSLPPGFERGDLAADGYYLTCDYAGTSYHRCALVATRLPWRWDGVVHECLACDDRFSLETLDGPRIHIRHDGVRSRDLQTYARDAALLEEAVRANPTSTRDVFYLAQSYRDAGELTKSREVYLQRAAMSGWDEEVWFSLYQAAVLGERLGLEPGQVTTAYLRAFQHRPSRAEPLVQLARYHRQRGEFALAYLYARHAAAMPNPADLLFLENAAYEWRALDELSIAAYYVGAQNEGREAVQRLLSSGHVPLSERPRIVQNAQFFSVEEERTAAVKDSGC
jgi:glycosyltransferase involved in cell wall biosynthesis